MKNKLANLYLFFSLLTLVGIASASLLTVADIASGSQASEAEFAKFKAEGATNFSADQGKANWNKVVISKEGEKRACITCHGTDPNKSGLHATTQKIIEPMSLTANPERFTDSKKMDKWFKRNCEWAWSRECTAQEKGDILKYLMGPN